MKIKSQKSKVPGLAARAGKSQKFNPQPTTHNPQPHRGFTLIEVLVAATIIALLSTIGISGFQAVTRSGRDALRKTDLEQIRSALEIYKSEYRFYPTPQATCMPALPDSYISPYPPDPKSPTYRYCYNWRSALQYNLCAHLEIGSGDYDYDSDCGGTGSCGENVKCNYQVTNP